MRKKHIIYCALLSIGVALLFGFLKIELSETFASAVLTVVSILFGFVITAMSMLLNSKYLEKAYSRIDNRSKQNAPELITIIKYFKLSVALSLWSISLIILYLCLNQVIGIIGKIIFSAFILNFVAWDIVIIWLISFIVVSMLIREAQSRVEICKYEETNQTTEIKFDKNDIL